MQSINWMICQSSLLKPLAPSCFFIVIGSSFLGSEVCCPYIAMGGFIEFRRARVERKVVKLPKPASPNAQVFSVQIVLFAVPNLDDKPVFVCCSCKAFRPDSQLEHIASLQRNTISNAAHCSLSSVASLTVCATWNKCTAAGVITGALIFSRVVVLEVE